MTTQPTPAQTRQMSRMTERQLAEIDEYLAVGLSLDAAINLASQKNTGHHVTR